ncbi:9289_t:CDS:2, partial [Funneliformis caledonium]
MPYHKSSKHSAQKMVERTKAYQEKKKTELSDFIEELANTRQKTNLRKREELELKCDNHKNAVVMEWVKYSDLLEGKVFASVGWSSWW